MTVSVQDIYVRGRGPYYVTPELAAKLGQRELAVLRAGDCAAFPHRLNTDADFFAHHGATTYYSPTAGQFTLAKDKTVIG